MNYVIYAVGLCLCLATTLAGQTTVTRPDIVIRDPFIYCDKASGRCYLYGTGPTLDGQRGFDVRETSDPTLQSWSQPKPAFRKPDDFWGVWAYWAPEVFLYKGKYYLFATFEAPKRARAVQILVADSPKGPFSVHSPKPITGPKYFSLDGTLYIDKHGDPWMVYSREHVSIQDGQMRAIRLKDDLTAPLKPKQDILLFKASDAPYAAFWLDDEGRKCYLTDGPQMLCLSNGDLIMAWATNNLLPAPIEWGYTVSIARSTSGDVQGPWVQEGILYNGFAGHGQIFRHPVLGLVLSVHQPNSGATPYPLFLPVYEDNGKLTMADPKTPNWVQAYWRFEDTTPGKNVLPSIDILDSSGKNNHLRGDDYNTTGIGSASVPTTRVPATLRLNLGSYDNSNAPEEDVGARYLRTVDGPIESEAYKNWTIEASLKPGDLSNNQVFLSRQSAIELALKQQGRVEIRIGGQVITSRSVLSSDNWYNLAVVCNGYRVKLYIDSGNGPVLDAEAVLQSAPVELARGRWFVGCARRDDRHVDQYRGLIDEIRISSKALTPKALLSYKVQ
ncbi:MAG: family 43 glycosylhydrolase [Armatimonadota bacterium]